MKCIETHLSKILLNFVNIAVDQTPSVYQKQETKVINALHML